MPMTALFRPFDLRDRIRITDESLVYFPSTRKVDIARIVVVVGAWLSIGLLSSAAVFGPLRLGAGVIAASLVAAALVVLKRAPDWLLGPSRTLPLGGLTFEVVDSERRAVRHVSTTRALFAVSPDGRWPLITVGGVSRSFEEIPVVAAELRRQTGCAS